MGETTDEATEVPEGNAQEAEPPTPPAVGLTIPAEEEGTAVPEPSVLPVEAETFPDNLFEPVAFDPVMPPVLESALGTGSSLVSVPVGVPTAHLWRRPRSGRRAADRPIRIAGAIVRSSLTMGAAYTNDEGSEKDGLTAFASAQVNLQIGNMAKGRYLTLQYGANVHLYDESDNNDEIFDQSLSIVGEYRYDGKLTLGVAINVSSLSGPERETGSATRRRLLDLSATARYEWSDKTAIVLTGSLPVEQYDDGIGSRSFELDLGVFHRYSNKTNVGIGLTVGTLSVDDNGHHDGGGGTQTFEEFTVRAAYRPSEKLQVTAKFGLEARQFESIDATLSPIFDVEILMRPTLRTRVSVVASQSFGNSAFTSGENVRSTTLAISLGQGIGDRTDLELSGGIEWSSYSAATSDAASDREDTFYFLEARATYRMTDRILIAGFCSFGKNDSNVNDYVRSVVGVSCTVVF